MTDECPSLVRCGAIALRRSRPACCCPLSSQPATTRLPPGCCLSSSPAEHTNTPHAQQPQHTPPPLLPSCPAKMYTAAPTSALRACSCSSSGRVVSGCGSPGTGRGRRVATRASWCCSLTIRLRSPPPGVPASLLCGHWPSPADLPRAVPASRWVGLRPPIRCCCCGGPLQRVAAPTGPACALRGLYGSLGY
jgi:hypothetical protein